MPSVTQAVAAAVVVLALACSGSASDELDATGTATDATAPAATSEDIPPTATVPATAVSPTPTEPGPTLSPSEPFSVDEITLEGPDRSVDVPVYVADEPALRQRGLMDRESLPAGTGMIFVFGEEHTGGFWMKNTLIPLSIAFLAEDGAVLAVLDMEPCTEDPCPVYDPEVGYHYALEVNQGFFDEIGLDEDWQADLANVADGG